MRILIWGMMLFTSLHVYSATLPGFKGNLADKIHPSLKMALLKEEMISDTSYISLLEIKAIEKLELQTDFRVWDRQSRKSCSFKISSLEGLEYFTSLRYLEIEGRRRDTILHIPSFSVFKELRELKIKDFYLPAVDVSGCRDLVSFTCTGCGLETLDLRKNIYLQKLECSFNNLSTVDLSRNRRLQSVILKRQTAWGVLDGDERPGVLVKLLLPDNRHAKEGVLKLDCSRNRLENLDIGRLPYLKQLNCSWNKLKTLDVSCNTELRELDCAGNYIGELNLNQNFQLESLVCGQQGYTWICNRNEDYRLLRKLSLPRQKENEAGIYLRKLSIAEVGKEAISVFSEFPYLKELNCEDNELEKIDLSANKELEILNCSGNQIAQLDFSSNRKLHSLNIQGCPLRSLDLIMTAIKNIKCDSYEQRKSLLKRHAIRSLILILKLPEGYHAETIDFRGAGGGAYFRYNSESIALPPQYIRLVVSTNYKK